MSSGRVGKVKSLPWPRFTVEGPDRRQCGHQHETFDQAEHCAINNAQRARGKIFHIVSWHPGRNPEEPSKMVLDSYEMKHG